MSIREKYNKQNNSNVHQTAASSLLEVNTETQKDGNTENQTKKATFVLDASLHTQLKTQAALEGRNMADIVSAALIDYLSKGK